MQWLDRFPLFLLVLVAAWLAVAPITPEPHVIEKLRMLGQGSLQQPIDILDLIMHTTPTVVLVVRLWRDWRRRSTSN